MQRYTYHVGLKTGNQVEIINFSKIPDYQKLAKIYGDGIKALDMFTSTFDNEEQLLNALDAFGLIKGTGSLNLFLRDRSSKGLSVREVRSGLLYRETWQYLSREKIIEFIKKNMSDPLFIEEAIKFFGIYFGAKNMPEVSGETSEKELKQEAKKIHPLNYCLVILDKYLQLLNFPFVTTKQRVINRSKLDKKMESEKALITMVDHLVFQKSRNGDPLIERSYRDLRDVALFCGITDKILQHNKLMLSRSKTLPRRVISQSSLDEMAAFHNLANNSSQEELLSELDRYNQTYDEYLTDEDIRGKTDCR
jgi:hypothetical protein